MSYKEYAMNEFKVCGWLNDDGTFKDDTQKVICDGILDIMEVFSNQGHSANYTINILEDLLRFKPLTPLTGEDSEWVAISDIIGDPDSVGFQNKRCSRVFKDPNGKAYDTEAVVFYDVNENGEKSYFTCEKSSRDITFPYTPTTIYEEADRSEKEDVETTL